MAYDPNILRRAAARLEEHFTWDAVCDRLLKLAAAQN